MGSVRRVTRYSPSSVLAALLACCLLLVNRPLAAQESESPGAPVATEAPVQPTQPGPAPSPAATEPAEAEAKFVGWLELTEPLREGPAQFAWEAGNDAGTRRGVVRRLLTVAEGPQYRGVVVVLDQIPLNLTDVFELGEAFAAIRAAGKSVIVYAEAMSMMEYQLAVQADHIALQKEGTVQLTGVGIEEMYFAGLFEKLGVQADFIQVGRFKGGEEPLTRTGPTEAIDEQMERLLDDLYGLLVKRIADGREMTDAEVEVVIADSWEMRGEEYVRRGLVDSMVDFDLAGATSEVFGDDFQWDREFGIARQSQQITNPFTMFQTLFQSRSPEPVRPTIAVIHAYGPIASGESQTEGLFGGRMIGSRTILGEFRKAMDNPLVEGVVFRVDSPGGSAIASEVIWQRVAAATDVKPVYVSIGNVAASGGYYVAAPAERIYASPSSLVGSIGVFGGKMVLGGLYDKLGLNVHRRSRGPLGGMYNSVTGFTDVEREAVRGSMLNTYELFKRRVGQGRGRKIARVERVAEGRVFTGRQAVANGLIDRLGGLNAAVTDLADDVGRKPGEYDVIHYPAPLSLEDFLNSLASAEGAGTPPQFAGSPLMTGLRQLVGEAAWGQVRGVLSGLTLLRHERVLLMDPRAIVVR